MSKQAKSFAAKSSSQFLSSTSFAKGNAMNTRNRTNSVLTLAAVATLVLTATSANAALLLTFTEEGSDVRLTVSGSVDLTNATFNGDAGLNRGGVVDRVLSTGLEWDPQGLAGVVGADFYSGVDLLGVDLTNATFVGTPDAGNSGQVFRINGAAFQIADAPGFPVLNDDQPDFGVFAPSGFMTFSGESFASMGLDAHTPNQLINLWGANANATNSELVQFTVAVATGTAPEPSTLILAALGLVGLVGTRRRRNR